MGEAMKKTLIVMMSVAVTAAFASLGEAQTSCPAEVAHAKDLLEKKTAAKAPRSLAGARQEPVQAPRSGQQVQAPRSLAGARPDAVQAPRGDQVQAPRGDQVQAPRGDQVQAPRGDQVQAPRSLAGAKPEGTAQAAKLIREAEAACKAGDMKTAKDKADAAISALR
jgi:hypothetical protein